MMEYALQALLRGQQRRAAAILGELSARLPEEHPLAVRATSLLSEWVRHHFLSSSHPPILLSDSSRQKS